jgi:ElaB/YqjD/DUF883 family membrane-anchored ribosome-binding protein
MAGSGSTAQNAKDKVESKAGEMKDKAKETASNVVQKAQDTAASVAQKAQDAGSNLAQKAQDVASNVGQRAQDMASTAEHKTDDALSTVGGTMSSLAGTLRERVPQEGTLGTAASAVAERLEAGGHYLQEHGLRDMTGDLHSLIRRYPLQSLLVGIGMGFLLGQMANRR